MGLQMYQQSEERLFRNLYDFQSKVIYFHDHQSSSQLEQERLERSTESRFINKCGGRLQFSINPCFATKAAYLKSRVNLIVCRWEDFTKVVRLFRERYNAEAKGKAATEEHKTAPCVKTGPLTRR